MPAFPPAALDDVEAANQRAFAANANQRLSDDANVARTSQQAFAVTNRLVDAVTTQALLGDSTNTQILQGREVRDQPQTTGTQTSPGVQSGVPGPGNTTPKQV